MIAYRICEKRGNDLLTLFHSLDGTRVLPVGTWLAADVKPVTDGSPKTATVYTSGFHVLKDADECREFVRKFTAPRDLVMVKCRVKGMRKKAHSRSNVFLADKMKLLEIVETLKETEPPDKQSRRISKVARNSDFLPLIINR